MRRDPSGPATNVGNCLAARGLHKLGKGAEHGPVIRFGVEFVAQEFGVIDGYRVVCGASGMHIRGFSHGKNPILCGRLAPGLHGKPGRYLARGRGATTIRRCR